MTWLIQQEKEQNGWKGEGNKTDREEIDFSGEEERKSSGYSEEDTLYKRALQC